MGSDTRVLIVNNIKLPINASLKEAFSVASKKLMKLNINPRDVKFSVYKRSIDARNKSDIKFVYSIAAEGSFGSFSKDRVAALGITADISQNIEPIKFGSESLSAPPIIVGAGPAGLFAALILAENGYAPIVIERGGSVCERNEKINVLYTNYILDPNTNIQFGAGGAGTFSDGKLVTRVNDPLCSYVLERFVDFGAPSDIKYVAKPHIGTDILSLVIENIISRITELGGKILYHTCFTGFSELRSRTVAHTTVGDMEFGALILAVGHSARDTYSRLLKSGVHIEAKDFSVGMRIEHLADDIDKAMYGDFAGNSLLGRAEYNLSYNTKERGVYTFCMCPGGEVVAATSEEFGVVVNGMSRHSRSGKNSNSAVVCSVFKSDYGATPEQAIEFQRKIERAAFIAGNGSYAAPIVTVGDFLSGRAITEPNRVIPTYMNGNNVKIASPSEYLPSFITDSIKNALLDFDKKINGFAHESAVLTGAETRTSAPVRILREQTSRLAIGYKNIYPVGEGAGYAGGITSASVDGIKTAIAIMERYKSNSKL